MGINGRSSFNLFAWVLIVASLVIVFSGETCNAKVDPKCTPSSCGHIHNISSPFRLKQDPKHCGKSQYTLSCENNITVLDLPSCKYHVQAINYNNLTIRVVDPGLDNNNCSSIPRYASYPPSDTLIGDLHYDYNSLTDICFFKCPNPVNSSLYVDTAPCISTNTTGTSLSQPKTYGYVTVDNVPAATLVEDCSLEWLSVTSSQYFPGKYVYIHPEDYTYNASYKYIDIHNALVFGFELGYEPLKHYACPFRVEDKCFNYTIPGFFGYLWAGIRDLTAGSGHNVFVRYRGVILVNNIDVRLAPLLIGTGLKFIIGGPFVMALLIYKWRRRHFSMYSTIEDFLHGDNNLKPIRYNYSNIKKMSNRFKDKLGEGGYGSVFKGKLRSGRFGAIKMLSKPKANGQDFMSEVATIGRINHVNVVQLIGYCVEGSKRALVYDFMPNGSLDKYIYSKEGSILLSCKQLYEISLGVAQGIEYLHEGCDMQILHFDIKPHNILLDENFVPKISDFGLAKLYPTDNSIVSLTAARGTMGYMAPELFYKNIGGVSYKADVYSFGMLLMEMASKRKNLNALVEHSSQIYFPSWVYDQYNEGKDLQIGDGTEEERKIVKKMVVTALWCIQLKPSDRPSMNKVIEMLEGDVDGLEIPPKPYLCPQEIPVCDAQDNLNPACSNVELTCTLSAR